MRRPVIAAAAKQAHARGKLLFAHPSNAGGLESALGAGVDGVVHTAPAMETWSDSLVRRMVKADVGLIPTRRTPSEARGTEGSSRPEYEYRGEDPSPRSG